MWIRGEEGVAFDCQARVDHCTFRLADLEPDSLNFSALYFVGGKDTKFNIANYILTRRAETETNLILLCPTKGQWAVLEGFFLK